MLQCRRSESSFIIHLEASPNLPISTVRNNRLPGGYHHHAPEGGGRGGGQ